MRFLLVLLLALVATVNLAAQPVTVETEVGTLAVDAHTVSYTTAARAAVFSRDVLDVAPRRDEYQDAIHDIGIIFDYAAELPAFPPLAADSTVLDSLEARVDELEGALALALENVGALITERDQLAAQVAEMEATVAEADARIAQAEMRAEAAEANYAAAMARVGVLDGRIRTFLVDLAPLLGQLRGLTIGPAETL